MCKLTILFITRFQWENFLPYQVVITDTKHKNNIMCLQILLRHLKLYQQEVNILAAKHYK